MFLAHSFRLRDPWQWDELPDGAVRWSRGFHRPTGLEADDALWLVIAGLPEGATVAVNGQRLSSPPGRPLGQFEITPLLADSNNIEITLPPPACGLASEPSPPAAHRPPPAFPYDVRLGVMAKS